MSTNSIGMMKMAIAVAASMPAMTTVPSTRRDAPPDPDAGPDVDPGQDRDTGPDRDPGPDPMPAPDPMPEPDRMPPPDPDEYAERPDAEARHDHTAFNLEHRLQ